MSGLHQVELEQVIDMATQDMVLRLEGIVYEAPEYRRTDVRKFTYAVKHPTWKHARIAELPDAATFRRRFLGYLWGIDPNYQGETKTHKIQYEGRAVFPDMEQKFPDSFGPVQYVVQARDL